MTINKKAFKAQYRWIKRIFLLLFYNKKLCIFRIIVFLLIAERIIANDVKILRIHFSRPWYRNARCAPGTSLDDKFKFSLSPVPTGPVTRQNGPVAVSGAVSTPSWKLEYGSPETGTMVAAFVTLMARMIRFARIIYLCAVNVICGCIVG